jgi:hypothetical protein
VIDQFQLDLERIRLLYGLPSDGTKGETTPASAVSKNEAAILTATAKNGTPN